MRGSKGRLRWGPGQGVLVLGSRKDGKEKQETKGHGEKIKQQDTQEEHEPS
jgi:hypothetical protein